MNAGISFFRAYGFMALSVEIMAAKALPETNTVRISMRQVVRTFSEAQRVNFSFGGIRFVY